MKCRVCGYEFTDEKFYCPMCGTRARDPKTQITEEEMRWNTKDFPQPREAQDIPMRWSSPDASEGYINTPYPKPQPPREHYYEPAYEKDPVAARVPRQEEGRLPEKFNTFVSKNDEFQRLLDKEFERLEKIKVEAPIYKEEVKAPLPQIEIKPAQRVKTQERFDIDSIEDKIEEIVAEEARAQAESSERKRKLAAMAAARDAYFQSLDDGLFEKKTVKKTSKYDTIDKRDDDKYFDTSYQDRRYEEKRRESATSIYREEPRYEAPVAEPVKKFTYEEIFRNYEDDIPRGESKVKHEMVPDKAFDVKGERTPNHEIEKYQGKSYNVEFGKESYLEMPKAEQAASAAPEESSNVEEIVGKLEPSPEHTQKFDKVSFIEAEQNEEGAKEAAEKERKEKLEAILNEGNKEYDDRKKEQEERAKEAQEKLQKIYAESDAEEDEDYEEDEGKKKHPFWSFILTILIIVGIIELGIFILSKFWADLEFTKMAIELNDAVIATIGDFFVKVKDKIVEWFGVVKDFVLRIFNKG